MEPEFSETGGFIFRLYYAVFGRRPTFQEFVHDRRELAVDYASDSGIERFLIGWMHQAAFRQTYPDSLSAPQFLSQLLRNAGISSDDVWEMQFRSGIATESERSRILKNIIASERFKARSFNESFLLMQYYGFLRRDPDNGEFESRLRTLGDDLPARQNAVGIFLNSAEYRSRFARSEKR